MAFIDTENLLKPISEGEPTGPNLEYDPAFAQLERAAQGKPDQQIGTALLAGEPPEWGSVVDLSLALLARSKDLRVVNHLIRALLQRRGVVGFAEGLSLAHGLVEKYWVPLHPQLDVDDANDPTIRVSALAVFNDAAVLGALRAAPLVQGRGFGVISLRDVAVAHGETPASPDGTKWDLAAIEGAMQDVPLEAMEPTAQALRSATEHLRGIETAFTENAGSGPDLAPLMKTIGQATHFLRQHIDKRRGAETPPEDGTDGAAGAAPGPRARLTGEIASRDDVVRAIDKICDYYARYEPSSPLHPLMRRCKRLASMSFLDIVREMAPEGLSQVEVIVGKQES